jgi:hypothetical protein
MPSESRHRANLVDRCWSIYLCLSDAFTLPENFHVEFPVAVENALITGTLHATVPIHAHLKLSLREEYSFDRRHLAVHRYSYNVIDRNGDNLFRADNLPFHRTDHRRRALTHPPHHLHDARGKVHSYSGQVGDFIQQAKTILASS